MKLATRSDLLQEEHHAKDLSTLVEVSAILASSRDPDAVAHSIVEKIMLAVDGTSAALYLYEPASDVLALRCLAGCEPISHRPQLAPGESIVGKSFAAGRTLVRSTLRKSSRGRPDWYAAGEGTREGAIGLAPEIEDAIAAPLVFKGRVSGVLLVESRGRVQAFDESHIQLIQAVANQLAMAMENGRLCEELLAKEEMRGQLLERLICAQEDERRRIARELHDETSQALTALIIGLGSVEEALPLDANESRRRLEAARGLTIQTLEEVRKIIMDLRPTSLDDLGLVPALRWYSRTQANRMGLRLTFEARGVEDRLPPQIETALFRVVQEALTNIARHAGARSVRVEIENIESTLVMVIEDDGSGFDVERSMAQGTSTRGLGLLGMKERVNFLGGSIAIDSTIGRGTRVIVRVPAGGVR